MSNQRNALRALVGSVVCSLALNVSAGPIILGGDDLNDHGSRNTSTNVNVAGWLYIQNALQNLASQSTYASNDGTIVVLGSSPSTSTSSNGCGAAYWAAQSTTPTRTVTCIDTAASITSYLAGVASGTNRPLVIVHPGDGVGNDVDTTEEAAWAAGATTISNYVAAGGGLLSHSGAYTWLQALVPGIVINSACNGTNATLTPEGQAAFPSITNTNIQDICHNTFSGSFGGLQVLARDGNGLPMILGGGAGTTFQARSVEIPTLPLAFFITLGVGLFGFGARRFARKSS
jgi:hypothetical protein